MATDPLFLSLRSALADAFQTEGDRIATFLESRLQKSDDDDLDQDVDDALDDYDDSMFETALQAPAVQGPLQYAYAIGFLGALAQLARWSLIAQPVLLLVTQRIQAGAPIVPLPTRLPTTPGALPPTASMQVMWGLQSKMATLYAQQRAAELVGRRRTAAGDLVDNPNAKWRITDTTRNGIKKLVLEAFTAHPSYRDIKSRLEAMPGWDTLFGEYRAEMVARSELAIATNMGHAESAEVHGVTHMRCTDGCQFDKECCDLNGQIRTVAYAKAHPLGHPNCTRTWSPVVAQKDSDGSGGPGISTAMHLTGYELDSTPACIASCKACQDQDHCVGGHDCTCHG